MKATDANGKAGKSSESEQYDPEEFQNAAVNWLESLFSRYGGTLEKASTGAAGLMPEILATQKEFLQVFKDEMQKDESKESRGVFQKEIVKTFLRAGLELYQENQEQRRRMQGIEERMLKNFKEAVEKVTEPGEKTKKSKKS